MKAALQLSRLVAGVQQDGRATATTLFRHWHSIGLADLAALAWCLDLAPNRRAGLGNRGLLLLADRAYPAWDLLLVDATSASIGHAGAVREGSQSHLYLWRHLDRRPGTLLEPALFPFGFGNCDSTANLARRKRGARSGRKVPGRISRLPQTNLVLNFSWNRSTSSIDTSGEEDEQANSDDRCDWDAVDWAEPGTSAAGSGGKLERAGRRGSDTSGTR